MVRNISTTEIHSYFIDQPNAALVKCWLSHLVLQAHTEDEVIVGNLLTARHEDIFGLPVDAHHLPSDHGDAGVQRQLGQVPAAVCMTAGSEEDWAESETKANFLTAHQGLLVFLILCN